jgi:hypothetical protein
VSPTRAIAPHLLLVEVVEHADVVAVAPRREMQEEALAAGADEQPAPAVHPDGEDVPVARLEHDLAGPVRRDAVHATLGARAGEDAPELVDREAPDVRIGEVRQQRDAAPGGHPLDPVDPPTGHGAGVDLAVRPRRQRRHEHGAGLPDDRDLIAADAEDPTVVAGAGVEPAVPADGERPDPVLLGADRGEAMPRPEQAGRGDDDAVRFPGEKGLRRRVLVDLRGHRARGDRGENQGEQREQAHAGHLISGGRRR